MKKQAATGRSYTLKNRPNGVKNSNTPKRPGASAASAQRAKKKGK